MNREEWEQEYKRLTEKPITPYLKAAGFNDDELSAIPAQTLGELLEMNLSGLNITDHTKFTALSFYRTKMSFLPRLAEYALSGEWEMFCSFGRVREIMQEAFGYFYDDMPDEYRRGFVIGCYQHHGDSIEECLEALRELRPCGCDDLPEECRNLAEITVYRAGEESVDEAKECFSWTLDKGVACFFRDRFPWQERRLYKAHIKPSDVIAYTDDRGEREVIQYMSVYDVEEI